MQTLFDESKVAEILSISVNTIRWWRQNQAGPPYVKIGRAVRYREDDLDNYIQNSLVTPGKTQ